MRKRVAVIGASANRWKYGNKAVRAFAQQGYEVLPVHPTATEVEGWPAFSSVLDIPGPVDLVTFYVPPEIGLAVIEEVARKGATEVWLNPGSESPELVARSREMGLDPILACSIMAIGEMPARF